MLKYVLMHLESTWAGFSSFQHYYYLSNFFFFSSILNPIGSLFQSPPPRLIRFHFVYFPSPIGSVGLASPPSIPPPHPIRLTFHSGLCFESIRLALSGFPHPVRLNSSLSFFLLNQIGLPSSVFLFPSQSD